MPRLNLWSRSAPRAEIDQRSRLRRLLYVFTVGRYGGLPHGDGEVNEPASDRWFLALLGFWLKNAEICNCPGALD